MYVVVWQSVEWCMWCLVASQWWLIQQPFFLSAVFAQSFVRSSLLSSSCFNPTIPSNSFPRLVWIVRRQSGMPSTTATIPTEHWTNKRPTIPTLSQDVAAHLRPNAPKTQHPCQTTTSSSTTCTRDNTKRWPQRTDPPRSKSTCRPVIRGRAERIWPCPKRPRVRSRFRSIQRKRVRTRAYTDNARRRIPRTRPRRDAST